MSQSNDQTNELDAAAINNFREYLRIRAVHPDVDYDESVEFIERQAEALNLPVKKIMVAPKKPVILMSWLGSEPNLPSILLNNHMDVVPVFEEQWNHKPFEAVMDEEGKIYGRGAQDMKCLSIEYLQAIKRMQMENQRLKRTVHLLFVPDEETGGKEGMQLFVKTKEFEQMNVGFVIDEGMSSGAETYIVHDGEKSTWQMRIHCPGQAGHGSLLHDNTAGEKVTYLLQKFYEFRRQEKEKLKNNPDLTIGDVTSINLTKIEGGVQSNVVPDELIITLDCRVALTVDMEAFEKTINQWCTEAGPGIWIEYEQKVPYVPATNLKGNRFWNAFKKATDEMGMKLKLQTLSAATDCRYLRELGITAIGFSTTNNTPILAHDSNEFIAASTFLKGIGIYRRLLEAVGNVEEENDSSV